MHTGESHEIAHRSPRLRTSDAAGMLAAHGHRSRHMAASASPVQPCSRTYDSARCAPARMVSSSAVTTCVLGVLISHHHRVELQSITVLAKGGTIRSRETVETTGDFDHTIAKSAFNRPTLRDDGDRHPPLCIDCASRPTCVVTNPLLLLNSLHEGSLSPPYWAR